MAVTEKWISRGYKITLVTRIVGISRSCYYYQTRCRTERLSSVGGPVPGYSRDKQNRRISDEQITEWLCEAIEGEGYNYGYTKLTKLLRKRKS